MRYLVAPDEALRASFDSVFDRALADGAPSPCWVVLDDDGRWLAEVARRPRAELGRGVLMSGRAEALLMAQRLGVGGAMDLPPSTPAATAALHAAAGAPLDLDDGLDLLDEAGFREPVALVLARNPRFWRRQIGAPGLRVALARVADQLEVPWSCGPGPALVVAGMGAARVESACDEVVGSPEGPGQGWQVVELAPGENEDLLPAAVRAVGEASASVTGAGVARPVFSLPDGHLQGWWSPAPRLEAAPGKGWRAWPETVTPEGHRWRLEDARGQVTVIEDACEIRSPALPGAVVRVPGWMSRALRAGGPAAPLVSALAEAVAAAGGVLWVSNVDERGLNFLLRLRQPLWVDGPAVPEG